MQHGIGTDRWHFVRIENRNVEKSPVRDGRFARIVLKAEDGSILAEFSYDAEAKRPFAVTQNKGAPRTYILSQNGQHWFAQAIYPDLVEMLKSWGFRHLVDDLKE